MVYMLTFGYIWGILMVNVTIYGIHGSYGFMTNLILPSQKNCGFPPSFLPHWFPSGSANFRENRLKENPEGTDGEEAYDPSDIYIYIFI